MDISRSKKLNNFCQLLMSWAIHREALSERNSSHRLDPGEPGVISAINGHGKSLKEILGKHGHGQKPGEFIVNPPWMEVYIYSWENIQLNLESSIAMFDCQRVCSKQMESDPSLLFHSGGFGGLFWTRLKDPDGLKPFRKSVWQC